MNNDILFVSGWAGYPELFPEIVGRSEFLLPFVRHGEREIFDRLDESGASTLMAWSLGAHMVLKRLARVVERFDRIILAAPFLSFTDYVSEQDVEDMVRSMDDDPIQVVGRFHKRCGFPGGITPSGQDVERLRFGLEYLRTSRAMPTHSGAEKITLIHGEYDRVISPHAVEDIWEVMPRATYAALPYGHWIPAHALGCDDNCPPATLDLSPN